MSKRLLRVVAVLVGALTVGLAGPAALAQSPEDAFKGTVTGLSCFDPNVRCTGFLPGVDGTALDVDLVTPRQGPYPLVVFVHGWAGSKGDGGPGLGYPGDQFFLDRGYGILRYSTRGFGKSWGFVGLADPEREIADIRSLVSAVVDDGRFAVRPDRIAVAGASYGGGQAWLTAPQPTWTTPGGKAVRIATVVPIAAWTSLASSLIPNGRDDDPRNPVGSPKFSYLTGLYGAGIRHDPERAYPNYDPNLGLLFLRALAGEPFQLGNTQDPVVAKMAEFLRARSVAERTDWLDRIRTDPSARVPVLAVEGWTDGLFPASEAIGMVRKLQQASPDYPVKLYLGDIGHPGAANKQEEANRLYGIVSDWLGYWLKDQGSRPVFDVTSATTTQGPFDPALVATVPSLDALSSGVVSTRFGGPIVLVNQPLQSGGLAADPITGIVPLLSDLARLVPPASPDIGGATLTRRVDDLAGGAPVWYQGRGRVTLSGTLLGTDAQYDVRVWDRDPQGSTVLVDRGTRKFVGSSGAVSIPVDLFGNAWRFAPGHELLVQVTNVDFPYLRPDNLPSSTLVDSVTVDLPVRGASQSAGVPTSAPASIASAATGTAAVKTASAPEPAAQPAAAQADAKVTAAGLAPGERVRPSAAAEGPDRRRPWLAALLAAPFLLAIGLAAPRERGLVLTRRSARPRSGTSG